MIHLIIMLFCNIIFLISILFSLEINGMRPDNRSQIIRGQRHILLGQKVLCTNQNTKYISNASCNIKLKSRDNQVYSFEINLHPNVSLPWLHVSAVLVIKILLIIINLTPCRFAQKHIINSEYYSENYY